jgi:hypothetical protein
LLVGGPDSSARRRGKFFVFAAGNLNTKKGEKERKKRGKKRGRKKRKRGKKREKIRS